MARASIAPGDSLAGFLALVVAIVIVSNVQAQQTPSLETDSVRTDSVATSDTAIVLFPTDSVGKSQFFSPERWRSQPQRDLMILLAGQSWPMIPIKVTPGGDLADWLSYHPEYDVDDAPGLGQTRFFTQWGLASRTGEWSVDGETDRWQRLTFPMTAQFDAGILPSYRHDEYHFGDRVILESDTLSRDRPQFDYVFRQGDFSDTYSEGGFRAHTARGFGLDAGFLFSSGDGRFAADNRGRRFLSLDVTGPLSTDRLWRASFRQFRDKTQILTPEPFDQVHPERNDLLWRLEMALAVHADSEVTWTAGARVQSGWQRLSDPSYRVSQRDQRWELFAHAGLSGWNLEMGAGIEDAKIDSIYADRWHARAVGSRLWHLSETWSAALSLSLSDYDTDPLELEATALLDPDPQHFLLPQLRAARIRTAPTLFDRERPAIQLTLIDGNQTGFLYSESGDLALEDQWENSLTLSWGADTLADSGHWHWNVRGHAAYVENYTIWDSRVDPDSIVGNSANHWRFRPYSQDARVLGAAVGVNGHLFWKLHYLANFAVKYATDVDDVRLSGYHPHKGSAMLSLNAPRWKYGIDVNINAAGLWWYGDRRIDPSGYDTPQVFRLDLGGSARIADLTIQALIQNVANFPYRTRAGYPFTGRTVRFGFHVTLFD